MEEIEVGTIAGYPVIYIPSRSLVFCKNTKVRLSDIRNVLKSSLSRNRIERSNLSILKEGNIIELGCLTTTISNLNNINKEILKYE